MDYLLYALVGAGVGALLVWWGGYQTRQLLDAARAERDQWKKLANEAIAYNVELAERMSTKSLRKVN